MVHFCSMKSLALCAFLLFSFTLSSQELFFKQMPFLFYSTVRESFVIWDGDTVYTAKKNTNTWTKRVIHYSEAMSAEELKEQYFPMNTGKADYFVMGGCGKVWQWRGDSLIRIDHSFAHKNQFGACTYVYHDTLMMTGGYGFFQTKNITTSFDPSAGGWFLRKTKGPMPPDRCGSYYFQGKEDIYFWGGEVRNTLGEDTLHSLWKLHLPSYTWQSVGVIHPDIQLPLIRGKFYPSSMGNWVQLGNRMLRFDADAQRVDEFQADRFYDIQNWVTAGDQVMTALLHHDANGIFIRLSPLSQFLGPIKKQYPMIMRIPEHHEQTWAVVGMLCYGWMIGVLGYYWVLVRRRKRMEKVIEDREDLALWSELEKAILEQFWSVGALGIEVAELNHHFNHGEPNYDTLKKRRELKLKELRKKISLHTGISEAEIFQEERLISDRRVKKIVLNPSIKREKLRIPPSNA